MAGLNEQFGTIAPERKLPEKKSPREECRLSGGYWDEQTQTCISSKPKQAPNKLATRPRPGTTQTPEKKDPRSSIPRGVPLTREQSQELKGLAEFERSKQGLPSAKEQIAIKEQQALTQAEGEFQAGQIGQFGELGAQSPGGIGEFDFGEAGIAAVRTAIPSAIGGAASVYGIAAGLAAAKTGAVAGSFAAPGVGTAVGAVLGFTAGIVGGMLANMNSQRRDTTTAQQRVLDEGKQVLSDWRTLAEANPSRRREAVAGFNAQLALIDQAYRQMKLDTQGDLLKFETALPNLAEFEAFYNNQGERDFLVQEMRLALTSPVDPNFAMLELADRRIQ